MDLDQPGSKPFCRLVFGLEHFNVLLEVRLLLTTLSMVYNARIWGRCVRNPFLLVLLAATMVNALHDVVAERACDTSGPCSLNAADQLRNLCPRLLARALLRLLNDIAARGAALERLDLVGSLRVHPIESGPAASTACRNIFWHSLMAGSCCLVSLSGKHRVRGGRE